MTGGGDNRECFEPLPKAERGPWSRARRPMRDGFQCFYVFHDIVTAQIISLDRPVAPFAQQLLRYQGVPREGVAEGKFL